MLFSFVLGIVGVFGVLVGGFKIVDVRFGNLVVPRGKRSYYPWVIVIVVSFSVFVLSRLL